MPKDNPFTRKREEPEPDPARPEYGLSEIAVAAANLVKSVPDAVEVRHFRRNVKQALKTFADRL